MEFSNLNKTEQKAINKLMKENPDGLMEAILDEKWNDGFKYGLQKRFRRCRFKGKTAVLDYDLQCVWTEPVKFEDIEGKNKITNVEDNFPKNWTYEDVLEHVARRFYGELFPGVTNAKKKNT